MVKKGGMTMKSQAMKCAVLAGGVVALSLLLTSGPALAHKNNTSSAISLSANPVTAGTQVTITATVTFLGTAGPGSSSGHGTIPANGTPVVGDTVKIQELMLNGVGVPCGTPGAAFTDIDSGPTDAHGQFSTNFDTTGLVGGSTICFRAHHPDSGDAHGNDQSASVGVDLVIINAAPSCSGVNVGATLAAGNGMPNPGDSGPWTFAISVENCTGMDLKGVKVQGGTSGWTNYVGYLVLDGDGNVTITNMPRNTQVLTWIVDIPNGQTKTILVTVNGTVPCSAPDGQVRYISGPWSAVFNDGSGRQKSAYSGRVSLTVDGSAINPSCQ